MIDSREFSSEVSTQWKASINELINSVNDDELANLVDKFLFCDHRDQRRCLEDIIECFLRKADLKKQCDLVVIRRDEVNKETHGAYCYEAKTLFLNFDTNSYNSLEDKAEALTFLFHELRHAYQNKVIRNDSSTNKEFNSALKDSLTNYDSAKTAISAFKYTINISEQDANKFSFKLTHLILDKLKTKNGDIFDYRDIEAKVNRFEREQLDVVNLSFNAMDTFNTAIFQQMDELKKMMFSSFETKRKTPEEKREFEENFKKRISETSHVLRLLEIKYTSLFIQDSLSKSLIDQPIDVIIENLDNPFIEFLEKIYRPGTYNLPGMTEKHQHKVRVSDLKTFIKDGKIVLDYLNIDTKDKSSLEIYKLIKEKTPDVLIDIINTIKIKLDIQTKLSKREKLTKEDKEWLKQFEDTYSWDGYDIDDLENGKDSSYDYFCSLLDKEIPSKLEEKIIEYCSEWRKGDYRGLNQGEIFLDIEKLSKNIREKIDERDFLLILEGLFNKGDYKLLERFSDIAKLNYNNKPLYSRDIYTIKGKFESIDKKEEEFLRILKQISPLRKSKDYPSRTDFMLEFNPEVNDFLCDVLTKNHPSKKDLEIVTWLLKNWDINKEKIKEMLIKLSKHKLANLNKLMARYNEYKTKNKDEQWRECENDPQLRLFDTLASDDDSFIDNLKHSIERAK